MADAAVFASGRGSNFIAIHKYLENIPGKPHRIAVLVSDKVGCGAVEYARRESIPVIMLAYAKGKQREIVEAEFLANIKARGIKPQLLVFAGFMRLVTGTLVDAFEGKIVNIHPSLLPRHAGAHGIEDSYKSGDRMLGITIHYVDHGMDTGPIIIQRSFDRKSGESIEEVEKRIHELEYETYPDIVETLLDTIEEKASGGRK